MISKNISLHIFLGDVLQLKIYVANVPRVGDEIRIGGEGKEVFYTVKRIVWVWDEPECPFDRVNIEVELAD